MSHIAEEDAVPLGYIWGAECGHQEKRGPGSCVCSLLSAVFFTHLPVQAHAPLISGSLTCDSLLSPQGLGPSWPPLLCSVSHSTAGSKPPDRTFARRQTRLCAPVPPSHAYAHRTPSRQHHQGRGLVSWLPCCLPSSWNSAQHVVGAQFTQHMG